MKNYGKRVSRNGQHQRYLCQTSHDCSTIEGVSSRIKGPNTYYELLMMLEGLSQSDLIIWLDRAS